MKQNKLILFDWGGVIESHDDREYNCGKATIDFLKSLGVSLSNQEILEKYYDCCNLVADDNRYELYCRVKECFQIDCSFAEYEKGYHDYLFQIDFYQDIVKYAHSLRKKCRIGILSNLTPFDKERLDYQVQLDYFDYTFLSFELKCSKPNPQIYDFVETQVKIPGNQILLIDDLVKNLSIPQLKGWHTCCATGHEIDKIKECVDKFLGNEE